jgi:putative ABC transport system permease protein
MLNQNIKPPRFLRILLYLFAIESEQSQILGDFEEEYGLILRQKGKLKALKWYILQILISFNPFIRTTIRGHVMMLQNYVKIAWRNITKYKGYSIINISGLSIGISLFLLIMLYVAME